MQDKKDPLLSYGANLKVQLAPPVAKAGLREIGLRVGTDKVTHHHYDLYYSRFLESFRERRSGAMLEIGIDQGKSLVMWLEYFKHAFVYGIDINLSLEGPRYRIFKADQADLQTLDNLVKTQISHPVFLIVDDGSHMPEHQAASFDVLFSDLLVPGGVYIIEDIEVSYWTRGGLYGYETNYGYGHPLSIIELFKHVLDDVNDEFLTAENHAAQRARIQDRLSEQTRAAISTVTFARNCIIITKKAEQELSDNDRTYRFADRL